MNPTLIILKDPLYGFEFQFMNETFFLNISKLCRDHHKDIEEWKKEHYDSLYSVLEDFAHHYNLVHYKSFIFEKDLYVDPSIAFHLAYWINYSVGITYCAIFFKMFSLIHQP